MKNIIDYVESEFATMSEKKFNPVDSLILSQVSNFEFKKLLNHMDSKKQNLTFKDLLKAEYFNSMLGSILHSKQNKKLLFALASSPRFRNIKIRYFQKISDVDMEKQFGAITYILDKNTAYIAFRGTDDSFIGWKEDFNMAFTSPVPSQKEGVNYINKVSKLLKHNLYVGGHSKGGNIAVYSAMNCNSKIFNRIIKVFSHDGPGFRKEIIDSPKFIRIKNKIHKTIPYSSIVGMLLEYHENYNIVNSHGFSVLQHNPFKWDISNLDFNYVKDISPSSKYFNQTIHQWLNNISDDKRKLFVDSLFQVLKSTNSQNFTVLLNDWKYYLPIIVESMKTLDPEVKFMILELLKELKILYIKNFKPLKNIKKINLPQNIRTVKKLKIKKYLVKKNTTPLN